MCGCLGNSGNPSDAPTGVQAVIGDSMAGVTWNSQADQTYYVFGSLNPALTTLNWTDANIAGFPLNNLGSKAQPPALLCSASNDQSFYFTIDAHSGTAAGGTGSPVVQATARPAGGAGTWRPGNTIVANISSVGYATLTRCLPNGPPSGTFVAVGPGGGIFTSDDGVQWGAALTPQGYVTDLFAVTAITGRPDFPADPARLFVAVGANGASITSIDGIAWTPGATSNNTRNTLRAIAIAGASFIAVGDNGRIQTSPDGVNWLAVQTPTSVNLHAIECVGNGCVAVGDSGVILMSTNGGAGWFGTVVGGGATALRAVAFGNNDNNLSSGGVVGDNFKVAINTWVVAGDNGAMFESSTVGTSSTTWNTVPVAGAGNFVGIGYSTQFVAIDANGNAFTSQTGIAGSWSGAVSTGVTNAIAITGNGHGSAPPLQLTSTLWITTAVADNSHGFVVVGSAGSNASSF